MARNIELGRRGEQLAADYLTAGGHRVLDRNWRCPRGELDLVTLDRGQVVAVEVKTRTSLDFGHPFEAIDRRKLERVYRLGWAWCAAHERAGAAVRVDAVAVVLGRRGERAVIEHLEGVR
ncbi:MAG: YraN family protein [Microbacteriaceae bacterium]|nr:YraN family protein [Microbacteriaceae bacterium]